MEKNVKTKQKEKNQSDKFEFKFLEDEKRMINLE